MAATKLVSQVTGVGGAAKHCPPVHKLEAISKEKIKPLCSCMLYSLSHWIAVVHYNVKIRSAQGVLFYSCTFLRCKLDMLCLCGAVPISNV